jgi:hypothetical protein
MGVPLGWQMNALPDLVDLPSGDIGGTELHPQGTETHFTRASLN